MKSPVRFYIEALAADGFSKADLWNSSLPLAGCWAREERTRSEAAAMDKAWQKDPRFRGVRVLVQTRETELPGRAFIDLVDLEIEPGGAWPEDLAAQTTEAVASLKGLGGELAAVLDELFPEVDVGPTALASLLGPTME